MGSELGKMLVSHRNEPSLIHLHRQSLPWKQLVNVGMEATQSLQKTFARFWNTPHLVRFLSVNEAPLYFWSHDEFYVSQVSLPGMHKHQNLQLRISDAACAVWLEKTLGSPTHSHPPFDLKHLTSFESLLLGRFSKEVLKTLTHSFMKKPGAAAKKSPLIHFTWMVSLSEVPQAPCGKIILTVPISVLRLDAPAPFPEEDEDAYLPEEMLDHAHVTAKLGIGRAHVKLEELQALEVGDLILLNESQTSQLFVLHPQDPTQYPFKAKFNNRAMFEVPCAEQLEQSDAMAMKPTHETLPPKEALWNNLMIDVSAEFYPTRLPLSDLREMMEGELVEVGELLHNRVRLHVEGKTIATGELLIVGDKFAVRVDHIKADAEEEEAFAHRQMKNLPAKSSHPSSPAEEESAEEEHDTEGESGEESLDDFLEEDFDEESFGEEDNEEW